MLPFRKFFPLPGLIEVHQIHRAGPVGEHHRENGHARPGTHFPHVRHFAVHRRLRVKDQLVHGRNLRPVLIAPGIAVQQIVHRNNAEPRELLRELRPDPFQFCHRIRPFHELPFPLPPSGALLPGRAVRAAPGFYYFTA